MVNSAKSSSPRSPLAELYRQMLHYVSAGAVTAAAGYGLTAVLSRVLSTSEFGAFALFMAVASFVGSVSGWNFRGALQRFYLEDSEEFPSFVRTVISALSVWNVSAIVLVWVFRVPLSGWIGLDGGVLFVGFLVGVLRVPWNLMWKVLVAQLRSQLFQRLSIARDISTAVLVAAVAVLSSDGNASGLVVWAMLFITALWGGAMGRWLLLLGKHGTLKTEHLTYALRFGAPLVPSAVAGVALNLFDRVVINQIEGEAATGVYSFAYNVGMVMNLGVMGVQSALSPIFIRLRHKEAYEELEDTVIRSVKILFCLAAVLVLYSREAAWMLGNSDYHGGLAIVPYVVLGYLALAFASLYSLYGVYRKKTEWQALATIVAGTLNVVLNYVFVPRFGYMAAAWTTFASFLILLFINLATAKWVFREHIIRPSRWLPALIVATATLPLVDRAMTLLLDQGWGGAWSLKIAGTVLVGGYAWRILREHRAMP